MARNIGVRIPDELLAEILGRVGIDGATQTQVILALIRRGLAIAPEAPQQGDRWGARLAQIEQRLTDVEQRLTELPNTVTQHPTESSNVALQHPTELSNAIEHRLTELPNVALQRQTQPPDAVRQPDRGRVVAKDKPGWYRLPEAHQLATQRGYIGTVDAFRAWGKRNPDKLRDEMGLVWHGADQKNSRVPTYEDIRHDTDQR